MRKEVLEHLAATGKIEGMKGRGIQREGSSNELEHTGEDDEGRNEEDSKG